MFAARARLAAASTSTSTAPVQAAARVAARRRSSQLSYAVGASDPPLVTSTLSEYFTNEILGKHSTLPALICRQETAGSHGGPKSRNLDDKKRLAWDFEEFERHIAALARGLIQMGVKPGDRVGVVMGNNR
jgi:hypothetical protein